jgi:NADPH:quinone reductase-like Zn-dependent oxidoreductase
MRRFVNEETSNGSLVPAIAGTFPLDEIVEAHRFLESGNQVGKVLVTI